MLNFSKDIMLENDRVYMRPLLFSDLDHLLPFALNEAELWTYSLVTAAGKGNLEKYIQKALENRIKEKQYPFIIFDKLKNEYAGCTRFYDIEPEHQTLLLGYTWYGKNFQGTGLNKNCKYLLLEYAFEHIKAERVEFRADSNNKISIAAMKSIGCTVEGELRSHLSTTNGKRRTSTILSILKDEWGNSVKNNLLNKL